MPPKPKTPAAAAVVEEVKKVESVTLSIEVTAKEPEKAANISLRIFSPWLQCADSTAKFGSGN